MPFKLVPFKLVPFNSSRYDKAFAMDAQLAAEGVADVEAAVEIEAALEAVCGQTPEKVAQWLETNLAEASAGAAAATAGAGTPKSNKSSRSRRSSGAGAAAGAAAAAAAGVATPQSEGLPLPVDSPVTMLIKARGGSAGGRAYGGLSARVAQLHKALRATRQALLRERQRAVHFQKMYAGCSKVGLFFTGSGRSVSVINAVVAYGYTKVQFCS